MRTWQEDRWGVQLPFKPLMVYHSSMLLVGTHRFLQQRKQQKHQKESSQVVGPQMGLEAVLADLPLGCSNGSTTASGPGWKMQSDVISALQE